MDEEEELENMLIGKNQSRTNTRPEEIAVKFAEGSSDLLENALLGAGTASLAKKLHQNLLFLLLVTFCRKIQICKA